MDVIHEDGIILPAEIDGQEIRWEADGNIKIDENNQLTRETVSISSHDAPATQSALENKSEQLRDVFVESNPKEEEDTENPLLSSDNIPVTEETSQDTFSLTAGIADSGETKVFRLRSVARACLLYTSRCV